MKIIYAVIEVMKNLNTHCERNMYAIVKEIYMLIININKNTNVARKNTNVAKDF